MRLFIGDCMPHMLWSSLCESLSVAMVLSMPPKFRLLVPALGSSALHIDPYGALYAQTDALYRCRCHRSEHCQLRIITPDMELAKLVITLFLVWHSRSRYICLHWCMDCFVKSLSMDLHAWQEMDTMATNNKESDIHLCRLCFAINKHIPYFEVCDNLLIQHPYEDKWWWMSLLTLLARDYVTTFSYSSHIKVDDSE